MQAHIVQFVNIYSYASIFPYLGPDEREDEENKETRERVKTKHIVWICVTVVFCFIGFAIVLATYLERPTVLKVLAVLLLVPTLVSLLKLPFERKPLNIAILAGKIISFAIFVYSAVILWSFAVELEDPDEELAMYVDPFYRDHQQGTTYPNQQFGPYPSQQQLENRGLPMASPYIHPQPYGYGPWQNTFNREGQPYFYQPQPMYYSGQPSPQNTNQPNQ